MKNKLKMIVGFDLILSLVIVTALILCLPGDLSNSFSRDIYNVGISVLSIVFSIFIAALGIIMSSGSDDFIAFLEEEK